MAGNPRAHASGVSGQRPPPGFKGPSVVVVAAHASCMHVMYAQLRFFDRASLNRADEPAPTRDLMSYRASEMTYTCMCFTRASLSTCPAGGVS